MAADLFRDLRGDDHRHHDLSALVVKTASGAGDLSAVIGGFAIIASIIGVWFVKTKAGDKT